MNKIKDTMENLSENPATADVTYPIPEFLSRANKIFGVPYEVVSTALRMTNKDKFTLAEAQSIVSTFLKREVK